jgi:hypothetical protein
VKSLEKLLKRREMPRGMSKILEDYDFAAVAGAQLGKHVIHRIADEAGGGVAKEPVGAAGMPAPKVDLIARVIDGAGLEADLLLSNLSISS